VQNGVPSCIPGNGSKERFQQCRLTRAQTGGSPHLLFGHHHHRGAHATFADAHPTSVGGGPAQRCSSTTPADGSPTRRSSPPLWAAAARADELACTAGRRRRARGVERGRRSWQRGRHGKESSSLSSPVWPSGPRLNTPPLGRVDRERRPSGRRAC
jgi:hypothetical protein